MAGKLGTLANSQGFFYGLQRLRNWGYVVFCTDKKIAELKAQASFQETSQPDMAVEKEPAKATGKFGASTSSSDKKKRVSKIVTK